jgi:hypothetical protein
MSDLPRFFGLKPEMTSLIFYPIKNKSFATSVEASDQPQFGRD